MALNFGKGNRSIAFAPTTAFPLNANSYFESYDLALAAALTAKPAGDTTVKYYFGQEIAVAEMIDNVPQSAKLYIIAPTHDEEGNVVGTLQEVGSATDGDGHSIELVDGVLSVRDFGKRYYKYIAATETEEAKYELVEVSEENPWKAGLQPRVDAEGNIGWYEPNPTTIEGVQDQVTGIQGDVEQAQKDIDAVEENLGKAEEKIDSINDTLYGTEGEEAVEGLVDKVADLEGEVTDLWSAVEDTYSKEEVDGLVSGVFHYKGIHEGTYEDLPSLTAKVGDVWQIGDKEYAWNNETWVELGFTIDLSAYATKQYVDDEVKKVQDAVTAHETAVNTKVGEIEQSIANLDKDIDDLVESVGDLESANATALEGVNKSLAALAAEDTKLDTRVGTLESYLGTPSESFTSALFPVVETLQETVKGLTSVGGEANQINGIAVNGQKLAVDENKLVHLAIFDGTKNGLVPVAGEGIDNNYLLSANGLWVNPIGNLGDFATVVEYVDNAIEGVRLVWEAIVEE